MIRSALSGTARVDITPAWPIMMAGFGQRRTASTGVRDRIFGKALYLSDGADALLLITADLICIPRPLGEAVIAGIRQASELAARQICVCASHTHSGPAPHDAGDGAEGVARYGPILVASLVQAGLSAIAGARPSRVRTGVGALDLFRNRRTRGAPNLVDRRVAMLATEDAATGAPIALLFGVGCHPVTLGWDNMQISGDFPGFAQTAIEAALPGVNALFFNSTEGNVVPLTSPNRDALDPRGYCGGTYADTASMGDALAQEAVRVFHASVSRPDLEIASGRIDLDLMPNLSRLTATEAEARLAESRETLAEFLGADFEQSGAVAHLWSAASARVVEDDLSEPRMQRLMIACCYYLGLSQRRTPAPAPRPVSTPIQVLRINDLDFLALPGEVLVETGQAWSRLAPSGHAFIIGLANSHLRYLPMAEHFAEPEADVRYETVTAGLGAGSMEDALDAASRLLGALGSPQAAWADSAP